VLVQWRLVGSFVMGEIIVGFCEVKRLQILWKNMFLKNIWLGFCFVFKLDILKINRRFGLY
jgi:hypothetical protein